jgi:hypothetical protein
LISIYIYLQTFDIEFFPGQEFQPQAAAVGAFQMMRGDLAALAAVQAMDFDGKGLGFDPCALGNGPFGQHVQVNLDAVRDDPAQFPDAETDDPDPGCILPLCLAQTVFQKVFGYTQFMHDVFSC